MPEECAFCQDAFDDTVVADYDHWSVELFLNQCYLGRCLVRLDRHAVDLTELTAEERQELFGEVVPDLNDAIDTLFDPDLYNYATLGNDCRHFHLHVIPRYSSERSFEGRCFSDPNWNSHYKPYPDDFEVSDEVFEAIRTALQEAVRYR